MRLIDNAGKVATRSWSMLFWSLAAVLNGIGLAWPLVESHVQAITSPFWFHIAGLVAGVGGQIARVIYQQQLHE